MAKTTVESLCSKKTEAVSIGSELAQIPLEKVANL